jgi:hypothetical protein
MFEMILGHLIGDYLLQNDWMATQKKKHEGLGWSACLVHCFLYTAAVCVTMGNFDIMWVVVVFFSHFAIDKFPVVEWYSKLIGSRSIDKFLNEAENQEYTPHIGLRSGITVLVYVVRDNTFHIMIMYYGWKLLYT